MQHPYHQRPTCPELAGYWQTFALASEAPLPLVRVPCELTDVIIAFVAPDTEGVLHFTGPNIPTVQDVCRLREREQHVLLSIGGGGVTVTLETPEQIMRFTDSLYQMIRALCVTGVDIDVEQGMPAVGSPNQPEGTALGLIKGLDCVLAALPPNFALTMAPETANLVGGMSRFGGPWGNYLPLLLHFGNRVTRIHMQYYNSGSMIGLDGRTYEVGTVPFAVAMTDAVIQGFPIADTGVTYPGLPPWKVSIGLPASPRAAINGYLSTKQIEEVFTWLCTGYRGEGQPSMPAYPYVGGLMTWSAQWDAQNNFAFTCNGARMLCR